MTARELKKLNKKMARLCEIYSHWEGEIERTQTVLDDIVHRIAVLQTLRAELVHRQPTEQHPIDPVELKKELREYEDSAKQIGDHIYRMPVNWGEEAIADVRFESLVRERNSTEVRMGDIKEHRNLKEKINLLITHVRDLFLKVYDVETALRLIDHIVNPTEDRNTDLSRAHLYGCIVGDHGTVAARGSKLEWLKNLQLGKLLKRLRPGRRSTLTRKEWET